MKRAQDITADGFETLLCIVAWCVFLSHGSWIEVFGGRNRKVGQRVSTRREVSGETKGCLSMSHFISIIQDVRMRLQLYKELNWMILSHVVLLVRDWKVSGSYAFKTKRLSGPLLASCMRSEFEVYVSLELVC